MSHNLKIKKVESLVMPHLPYLHRVARRFCNNRSDADDLVHDLLVKLFEQPDLIERVEYLKTWLVRCLYNLYIDGVRKNSKTVAMEPETIQEIIESGSSAQIKTLEEIKDLEQLNVVLGRLLSNLPATQRAIVVLHDMEGYQLSELATQLDIPIGTVKSRLHRGRERLKALLIEAGYGKLEQENDSNNNANDGNL
ncbi:MAG: RNA polymerase sigma factor [Methylacidiphilales bacterium]|nr:RNA polymerase sigma factor [Candidatus Methylacidiphilales bacterium]